MSGGHITGYHALPSIAEEIERIIAEQDLGPEVSGRYRLAVQHARRAYEAIRAVDYLESGDYGRESFVQAWDEYVKTAPGDLESSRAEVEQARIELEDERERVNVQREDIRTLRGEVQRLTEEARRSDAGRVEVPELTDEDEVWQGLPFRPEYQPMCGAYFAHGYNHARSKARRSDAGRVVVPEITKQDLPYKGNGAPGYEPAFVDYGFARGWQALAARLGHAPSVEKERKQKQRDHYEEWDRENRLNGVEL